MHMEHCKDSLGSNDLFAKKTLRTFNGRSAVLMVSYITAVIREFARLKESVIAC